MILFFKKWFYFNFIFSSHQDTNTLIKRSSSAILAKKEKESKENIGFSSMKIYDHRPARPKITAANMLVSPLKRPHAQATRKTPVDNQPAITGELVPTPACLMPPPQSTVILKMKAAKRIQ